MSHLKHCSYDTFLIQQCPADFIPQAILTKQGSMILTTALGQSIFVQKNQ